MCVQFVYIRFFHIIYYLAPNLIKDILVDLIERTLQREGSLYIACNDKNAFFTSDAIRNDTEIVCSSHLSLRQYLY